MKIFFCKKIIQLSSCYVNDPKEESQHWLLLKYFTQISNAKLLKLLVQLMTSTFSLKELQNCTLFIIHMWYFIYYPHVVSILTDEIIEVCIFYIFFQKTSFQLFFCDFFLLCVLNCQLLNGIFLAVIKVFMIIFYNFLYLLMMSTNIGRFFGPHDHPQGPQSFKFRLLPPIVHSVQLPRLLTVHVFCQ